MILKQKTFVTQRHKIKHEKKPPKIKHRLGEDIYISEQKASILIYKETLQIKKKKTNH